ncbi:hypothetical protein M0804_011540 [Polistes exclamans]|nr:hypothetical protein M0804_011540 [Polistes exclamans]
MVMMVKVVMMVGGDGGGDGDGGGGGGGTEVVAEGTTSHEESDWTRLSLWSVQKTQTLRRIPRECLFVLPLLLYLR